MAKWFKSGAVYESVFFEKDLEAVEKAREIIEAFNELGGLNQNTSLNIPGVWKFEPDTGSWAGQKVLVEPFITGYRRFNSNNGYVVGNDSWSQVSPNPCAF